ncbi:MAG: hypothetical protein ACWGO1_14015, partial [Anaerolineales bacterium]
PPEGWTAPPAAGGSHPVFNAQLQSLMALDYLQPGSAQTFDQDLVARVFGAVGAEIDHPQAHPGSTSKMRTRSWL